MTRFSRGLSRMLGTVVCITATVLCSLGQGDDDTFVDDVDLPPRQQGGGIVDLGAHWDGTLSGQFAMRQAVPGNAPAGSTLSEFIRQQAARKMRRLESACGVTSEQRQALELALEMDTTRLIEEIDATRKTYVGRKVDIQSAEGRRELQLMQRDLAACSVRLRDHNPSESLFAGVLADVLDESQRQRIDAEHRALRQLTWQTIVANEMAQFDDLFGLTHAQHMAIERLLLDSEPALVADEWSPGMRHLHEYQMLVYAALADIGRTPLREIIDRRFWGLLDGLVNQGTGARRWVQEQGLVRTGDAR